MAAILRRAVVSAALPRQTNTAISAKKLLCPRRMSAAADDPRLAPRERVEYDVVIVGAGPAGLSAAIKLKQLAAQHCKELTVCVVEKGHEVGAHIISGNVFEPRALNELIPDWKEKGAPLTTAASEDAFYYLTEKRAVWLPTIPLLHNGGNYVCSLSQVTRWMGKQAEELGVDIFPASPVAEVLYASGAAEPGSAAAAADPAAHVCGVATADVGIGKDGRPKDSFSRGMEILGRQTLFAEGVRGSCSEDLMARFGLRAGRDPQTYGLGVKEVWRVPPGRFPPGYIQHTFGWPLPSDVYGGSFLYHGDAGLVMLGFVVGLDYKNPYLSPYQEFQRWKHHPAVARHLEGGECIQYGARCINEGGLQALPKLTFPGGALLGCSAGFLNVPKIKGTHLAMKSGMVAAEAVFHALAPEVKAGAGGRAEEAAAAPAAGSSSGGVGLEVTAYQRGMEASWAWAEMASVRNYHPAFKAGQMAGVAYSGLSAFVLRGREPWTFHNTVKDCDKTLPAAQCAPIAYPKPDGVLSFELLTNLARSGTNHEGDQPAHLRVKPGMEDVPAQVSLKVYAGPEGRFCPAKVYEYPEDAGGKLVINAQNCVHCKCCSIKTPREFIRWTVPEAGGGGPA